MFSFKYDRKVKDITVCVSASPVLNVIVSNMDDMWHLYDKDAMGKPKIIWKLDEDGFLYAVNNARKYIYLIDLLMGSVVDKKTIVFIDKNRLNYKRDNIKIDKTQKIDDSHTFPDGISILEQYRGKISLTNKKYPDKVFNPYWKVHNKNDDTIHYVMYCENDVYVYLSEESINDVVKHVWTNKNDSVYATIKENNVNKSIQLHTYIANDFYGEMQMASPSKHIKHMNGNNYDDRLENIIEISVVKKVLSKENRDSKKYGSFISKYIDKQKMFPNNTINNVVMDKELQENITKKDVTKQKDINNKMSDKDKIMKQEELDKKVNKLLKSIIKTDNEQIKKITKIVNSVCNNVNIVEIYDGHASSVGCKSRNEQNPFCKVIDKTTKQEYYVMLMANDNICLFSKESLPLIINIDNYNETYSWYQMSIGYTAMHTNSNNKKTTVYMHHIILKLADNMSVDHINTCKYDNRISNLRLTTQSEQNKNRVKVRRHIDAKPLPDDIKDIKMPKFMWYSNRMYKGKPRQYFVIEKHPIIQDKRIFETTKSNNTTNIEKFNEALKIVNYLNKKAREILVENKLVDDDYECNENEITYTERTLIDQLGDKLLTYDDVLVIGVKKIKGTYKDD